MCKSKKITSTEWSASATCKSALYDGNGLNFLLSILGIACKASAMLGFSVFTQKVIDTISGERSSTVP